MSMVDTANNIPEFVIGADANGRAGSNKGQTETFMVNDDFQQFDPESSSESQPLSCLSKFEVLTYYLQNVSVNF